MQAHLGLACGMVFVRPRKKPHVQGTVRLDLVVPEAGIEPARLAAGDFESPASTNFTTRAGLRRTRL